MAKIFVVDCDSEIIFGKHTSNTSLLPNEPHDLRIESFSKAQHFRNSSSEHQLNIEISWQTPPNSEFLLNLTIFSKFYHIITRCF